MNARTISFRDRLTAKEVLRLGVKKLSWIFSHFFICLEVARERRRLLALDDRALKDIGISRVDALREGTRGFWDMPDETKPSRHRVKATRVTALAHNQTK